MKSGKSKVKEVKQKIKEQEEKKYLIPDDDETPDPVQTSDKVYVAASFCYEDRAKTSQRKYLIEKTVQRIGEAWGKDVDFYLPHLLTIPDAWDMSLEDWARKVFEHDMEALTNSNVVIFLSFGKENNAGSAWEVGFVSGLNCFETVEIPIITVKMTDEPESLMITNSCHRIIHESEIERYDWQTLPLYKTYLNKLS